MAVDPDVEKLIAEKLITPEALEKLIDERIAQHPVTFDEARVNKLIAEAIAELRLDMAS